jgi:hypothetical protein
MKPSIYFRFRLFACGIAYIQAASAAIDQESSTPSMKVFRKDAEQLVVYTDVPGHDAPIHGQNPSAKSAVYEIRVRSAATEYQWVKCFASHTYNRAKELPKIDANPGHRTNPNVRQGYQRHTGGWSQTYANIEMSDNSTVEVEISKIGDTKLDGSPVILKSAVHPAHKVSNKRDENGKVVFRLNKPCQLVIDINGQMDDHNAAIAGLEPTGPVHAVSLFANPILEKPPTSGDGIRLVKAGTKPNANTDYDTLVFGPGVHDLGKFIVHPHKKYYLPGDAILYGSLSNDGATAAGLGKGDSITVYGYGTISGFFNPHYQYNHKNPSYPADAESSQGIVLKDAINLTLNGVTFVDPATFTGYILPDRRDKGTSRITWTKAITWRTNGDGFAVGFPLLDCFLRTGDDLTSLGADRIRCTLWKDSNANMVRLRNYSRDPKGSPILMDDCDILYNRLRNADGSNGCVFPTQDADGKPGMVTVNVTIRNVRFHDRKSNMRIFNLDSASSRESIKSYSGLRFENVSCNVPINPEIKNKILGTKDAPWTDSPIFKNVTFNHGDGKPPVLLTKDNFKKYFITNDSVSPQFLR